MIRLFDFRECWWDISARQAVHRVDREPRRESLLWQMSPGACALQLRAD